MISKDPAPILSFVNPNNVIIRYPAGGPFYPTEFAAANGLSGDLDLLFNAAPLGPRINQVDTSAWRSVLGADGVLAGWDYGAAFTWSRNDQSDSLVSGHVSLARLSDAMATGLVNPFGPSGPQGDALLAATQVGGEIHTAKGTTLDFLVKGSRDTVALPGGPLALAVGADARRERLSNDYTALVTSGDIAGVEVALQSADGSRSAQALFVEASLPFAKGFEAQVAARYDHYSDFGGTWNPKLALRWQPVRSLLLRTSWGTGFRAPPLYDLHTPQERTFLSAGLRGSAALSRHRRGERLHGRPGGRRRKPQPASGDLGAVQCRCRLGAALRLVGHHRLLEDRQVRPHRRARSGDDLRQLRALCADQHRPRAGRSAVSKPPGADQQRRPHQPEPRHSQDLWHRRRRRLPRAGNGHRTLQLRVERHVHHRMEDAAGRRDVRVGAGPQRAERPGTVPRWKHYAALDWEYGAWGATLAQTFQSGYEDTNLSPVRALAPPPRSVSSYEVWDLQGRYTGWRNTKLVVGVKNLFDRAPPFTNQPFTYQVGYDPNYADPRGRTFYASVTFAFK